LQANASRGFRQTIDGTEYMAIYHNNSAAVFEVNAAERARIDSSGRLLVGTSSARDLGTGGTHQFQVEAVSSAGSSASLTCNTANDSAAYLTFAKARAGTIGSNAVVLSGDYLGHIQFNGADGTDIQTTGARISAVVDGAASGNDLPTRLEFSTTADGASSPTERVRITNVGFTKCLGDQGSPDSATGAWHEFLSNQASVRSAHVKNFNTSYTGQNVIISCNRTTTNNTYQNLTVENGNATGRFIVLDSGNCQNTNNSYTGTSDIKLKQDIVDASSQWDDIKNLQVRKYRFKSKPDEHLQIGLIAQEVESVSPGLVEESPDYDQDGNQLETATKSVKYSVLYMKAVKALQEAMERIEQLEAAVTALQQS
jgi:hypothetical protein